VKRLQSSSGLAVAELDYELNSVARSDLGGTLDGGFTAHPKADPLTGEVVALTYDPTRPTLRYVVIDATGRAQTRADMPTPHKPMVHDVGFTRQFVVVLDLPQLHPGHIFPYFWNGARSGRVGLLPRNGDLNSLAWFDVPACFVFHAINAYEAESDEVIVDVVRHPRSFDRHPLWPDEGAPKLIRWTLNRKSGALSEPVLDERPGEFPRINDARSGQSYRYAYTGHWWAIG
jgi:carotenoid cleavage dioxygenase